MSIKLIPIVLIITQVFFRSCPAKRTGKPITTDTTTQKGTSTLPTKAKPIDSTLQVGAAQMEHYLDALENKRVGLVVNHTSLVNGVHLVDTLLASGVKVQKIFAPEHGFRGTADAGEVIQNAKDTKTGLPIISLYGSNKKPTAAQLKDIDILIFDIQDVGVRFYTYISTMHYVMEACADNRKRLLILDRPNPHGNYVDGCVLKPAYRSFVGMHPIPIVHGLTVGELARMINGEGWLLSGKACILQVVPVKNYHHSDAYTLPVKPSPNLPNQQAILLYPSLCLFEGTKMSVGRGTPFPFQVVGAPDARFGDFQFTPSATAGAKNPLYKGQTCYGIDLRTPLAKRAFTLRYLIDFYRKSPNKNTFFNNFFDKLVGTDKLRKQIVAGMSEEEIRASWQEELTAYRTLREKYLLYFK